MSSTATAKGSKGSGESAEVAVAVGLVGVVIVMIVPLPSVLVDTFLSVSISVSLLTFLASIYVRNTLELSIFPTLVLVTTLLRLALNIATTRLILLNGAEGELAAGNLVRAFGQFVVGGNYVVGVILFLILIVINFAVITKGAGRVAEVSARFTLDAMPGRQMAIDADLGAGLIDEREARRRRELIQEEASFHGAMDGASKFVKGDAVAGLIITAINIFAGAAVGILQHGMDFATAAQTFIILSVGDGLVSQIPALLVSTAAAIVVTRSSGDYDLGPRLISQITRYRKPAGIAAGFLALLAVLPGMPHLILLALAGASTALALRKAPVTETGADKHEASKAPSDRELMEQLLPIDLLELEVGYELVSLVDESRDGNLLGRISAIRRQFATDLGVIVPPVHVRDNLQLAPGEYRLMLSGNEVGRGEVMSGRFLAMDPSGQAPPIGGKEVREPAFGLPARWISASERVRAENLGYTVVDAATVAATHLGELLRRNAHEMLGRSEVQELLDIFSKSNPKLVEELVPNLLSLGDVIKVLRNLLREGVSIRDLRTILEALADHAGQTKEPDILTELVRQRMAKHLTMRVRGEDKRVHALVLDPGLEQDLRVAARSSGAEPASFEAHAIPRVLQALERSMQGAQGLTEIPVLLVSPDIRPYMSAFASRHTPGLSVYSYREIEPNTSIHTLGVVGA